MNNTFRELRATPDEELAAKFGLIRLQGGRYLNASTIVSFELVPQPDTGRQALKISTRRSDHLIGPNNSNRVLALVLAASEHRGAVNTVDHQKFRQLAAENADAIGAAVAKQLATGESELTQRIRLYSEREEFTR